MYENLLLFFLFMVFRLSIFFFSWVNLVQLEQEVQQMSNVRLKWSMLTTDRLCWLPEPPCEKGGNCICQDREERAGTTTSFPFRLLFFPSLRCLSQMRLVRRKGWRKTGSTQEKWIGQSGSAVRNLYALALAWGVLCP